MRKALEGVSVKSTFFKGTHTCRKSIFPVCKGMYGIGDPFMVFPLMLESTLRDTRLDTYLSSGHFLTLGNREPHLKDDSCGDPFHVKIDVINHFPIAAKV
jgi:hypothetical protein